MRIGIDLMGSDTSPLTIFDAVADSASHFPNDLFSVFLTPELFEKILQERKPPSNLTFISQPEVIHMTDEPLEAYRKKKNSTLIAGIKSLKKKRVDAFITTGNTGALIASSTLMMPLLAGIKRPALLTTLPTAKHPLAILDVGGNVLCKAHHLIQFALMGAAFQHCAGIEQLPRVGLLNIGIESSKGKLELRQAYQKLMESVQNSQVSQFFEFIGNIEGRDIFEGKADVLVTDGFSGNVLLKTSEGLSVFILEKLKTILTHTLDNEQKSKVLEQLKKQFDYKEYGGAILCGIEGIILKCHGNSTEKEIKNSINLTIKLIKQNFIEKLNYYLNLFTI